MKDFFWGRIRIWGPTIKKANLICAALVSLFVSTLAHAEASSEKMFYALENAWNEAHLAGDLGALENLWADDIEIFVPSMPPLSKAEVASMWQEIPVTFTKYESGDVKVRRVKDLAVVTGRIERARVFGGRSAEEHWYFTKVYERRNRRWRIVVFHASPAEN